MHVPVVGGTGFIASALLLMIEVQKKWWLPNFGDLGWHSELVSCRMMTDPNDPCSPLSQFLEPGWRHRFYAMWSYGIQSGREVGKQQRDFYVLG